MPEPALGLHLPLLLTLHLPFLLTLPAALGLEGPHSEPWASPYPINWKGDGGGVGWRKAADAAAVVTSTHSNRQQQQ